MNPAFPLRYALEMRTPAEKPGPKAASDLLAGVAANDQAMADLQRKIDEGTQSSAQVITTTGADGTSFARFGSTSPSEGAAQPSPSDEARTDAQPAKKEQAHDILFALALPPESVSYSEEPAEAFTITQGATVLEENGRIVTTVRIQGSFGASRHLGTDRNGAGQFWDGIRLHVELVAFLDKMWKEQAEGKTHELVWRDYAADRHMLCAITQFESRLTRIVPEYSATLRCHAKAESKPASFVDEHFGFLRTASREATDFISRASYYTEVARVNVESALDLADSVLDPLREIDHLTRQIGRFAATLSTARQIPRNAAQAVFQAIANVTNGINDLAAALGVPASSMRWARDATQALRQVEDETALAFTASALAAPAPTGTHVLSEGDTLQGLSQQYYGSRRYWPAIAQANALRPPYISTVGLPHTKGPGDEIVIPGALTATGIRDTLPNDGDAEERLYGRDILRDATTRDWRVNANADGVETTSGRGAVAQGLQARLQTFRGSNRLFPRLGLAMVGQPGTERAAAMLAAQAREQATSDDRIVELAEPSVTWSGSALRLTATCRLRGTPLAVPVELPLEQ